MRPNGCRRRPRRDLVERLAPYLQTVEQDSPIRWVSAEPLRLFLLGWSAATGDRAELVAQGFGVRLEMVEDLLSGELHRLTAEEALAICSAIRVEPTALWARVR